MTNFHWSCGDTAFYLDPISVRVPRVCEAVFGNAYGVDSEHEHRHAERKDSKQEPKVGRPLLFVHLEQHELVGGVP